GKCYRSQRKLTKPYSVTATVAADCAVGASGCECAAKEGLCNHVLALLRLVALLKGQEYEEPFPEVSFTELPQQWRRPRGTQTAAASVDDVDWRSVREGGTSKHIGSRLYDARKCPRDLAEMQDAMRNLKNELGSLGDSPFAKHLRDSKRDSKLVGLAARSFWETKELHIRSMARTPRLVFLQDGDKGDPSMTYSKAEEWQDILAAAPTSNQYDNLKAAILARKTASERSRLQHLLNMEELGDQRPSQLLRRMRQLLGDATSDADTSLLPGPKEGLCDIIFWDFFYASKRGTFLDRNSVGLQWFLEFARKDSGTTQFGIGIDHG
ncbi:hypothetical protein HPB47_006594, partial [Ixodes persulcatus]